MNTVIRFMANPSQSKRIAKARTPHRWNELSVYPVGCGHFRTDIRFPTFSGAREGAG